MRNINKDRLFDTFSELVAIDSLSFHERKMADELIARLNRLGFEVSEDEAGKRIGGDAGNIFAVLPSTSAAKDRPTILFSAHMDTVAPGEGKQAILHDDGRITSDGSTVLGADDAGGIAEILEAVEEILEEGIEHPGIELFFPVAEESYCIGSYAFDTSVVKADRAYFLDRSGEVGTVTMSEPTLISFEIEVEGKASHAGFDPEKGVNAIVIASRAIADLPVGRVDEDTTLAIGLIEGGTATNIVPDHVVIGGEIRSNSDDGAYRILKLVEDKMKKYAAELGGRTNISHTKHLSAYRVEDDSRALYTFETALGSFDIEIKKTASFGGSDTNAFRANGIDAVCIANAMYDIHTTSEYTTLDEMVMVTDILKAMILADQ